MFTRTENNRYKQHDVYLSKKFKIKPTRCEKCGQEHKFQSMYEYHSIGEFISMKYYGCMYCFRSINEFYLFMIDKRLH